ncbi:MAG: hypothetical protein JSU73_01710 [candidate division WOR-3 bacterium]|nr:MAG: hypothetical protein JSU73_01710 [candidate division WOR-3 bacterium]
MATSELHSFVTGPLIVKLKTDITDMRIFNRSDLHAAAYFHIRRLLLVRAGWMCRTDPENPAGPASLVLTLNNEFQGLAHFEFLLRPKASSCFPADELDERMARLRKALAARERDQPGRAYLVGVFDTAESWFYPEEPRWQKQSCQWVPINCHAFPRHDEWRSRWEKLAVS